MASQANRIEKCLVRKGYPPDTALCIAEAIVSYEKFYKLANDLSKIKGMNLRYGTDDNDNIDGWKIYGDMNNEPLSKIRKSDYTK